MRAWVYLKTKIFSKTLVYMMIGSTPETWIKYPFLISPGSEEAVVVAAGMSSTRSKRFWFEVQQQQGEKRMKPNENLQ